MKGREGDRPPRPIAFVAPYHKLRHPLHQIIRNPFLPHIKSHSSSLSPWPSPHLYWHPLPQERTPFLKYPVCHKVHPFVFGLAARYSCKILK
ncbi:hypothetical protein I3843_16G030300 [Carya illinoinensis]|nr:hypothetical protein I3843_16G030300 [Carya illinoinensis]